MNNISDIIWKVLRSVRGKVNKFRSRMQVPSLVNFDEEKVNALIAGCILQNKPIMITRFGSVELSALVSYHDLCLQKNTRWRAPVDFVLGNTFAYRKWDPKIATAMKVAAGFFPTTEQALERFGTYIFNDVTPEIDVLFSIWPRMEWHIREYLRNKIICGFDGLMDFRSNDIWTSALKGKRVLVIHPFEASILHQYAKRNLLFRHSDILPNFTLLTLKAVQTIGDQTSEFADWFEALSWMNAQIDSLDFDVALIGAGAYGMPLAAHVKKLGKTAIHVGGGLQLLFGIKGARWDSYGLYNEHWIRPLACDVPAGSQKVEGGCYW